jgi:hypothetical protein
MESYGERGHRALNCASIWSRSPSSAPPRRSQIVLPRASNEEGRGLEAALTSPTEMHAAHNQNASKSSQQLFEGVAIVKAT